jgi:hypothetical protein
MRLWSCTIPHQQPLTCVIYTRDEILEIIDEIIYYRKSLVISIEDAFYLV